MSRKLRSRGAMQGVASDARNVCRLFTGSRRWAALTNWSFSHALISQEDGLVHSQKQLDTALGHHQYTVVMATHDERPGLQLTNCRGHYSAILFVLSAV